MSTRVQRVGSPCVLGEKNEVITRFNRDERGATSVEMAMVAGLLLFFIFTGIDLLYLSYQSLSLQYTATTALRTATIGEPDIPAPGYNHVTVVKKQIKDTAAGFGLELKDAHIKICPITDPACPVSNSAKPGDLIVVRIDYPSRVLFYDQYTINAMAIGKNEPT